MSYYYWIFWPRWERYILVNLLGIVHEQKHPCAPTCGLGGGGGGGLGGGGGGRLPVSFLLIPAFI